MIDALNRAIAASDLPAAENVLNALLGGEGDEAWSVHESLFVVVQRVLNPPFINPHLPKMYAINRELAAYLAPADLATLVGVEVEEYTRREKAVPVARPAAMPVESTHVDLEAAIRARDVAAAAAVMAARLKSSGPERLAAELLLLGSGSLSVSLGHSISCTAFILLEMIERPDQDPWPVLALLAAYFCAGAFYNTPEIRERAPGNRSAGPDRALFRAVSGSGIVALHHTITRYAIERSRRFFTRPEYEHVLAMWAAMMADKPEQLCSAGRHRTAALSGYDGFFRSFSHGDPERLLPLVAGALASEGERSRLGSYLVRAVLDCYNGRYNPHALTGLGSVLWVMNAFHGHPGAVCTAFYQYLDYFFSELD